MGKKANKKKTSDAIEVPLFSLSKVSSIHWLTFVVLLAICGVAGYHATLPFFAERNYRDGYHTRALAIQWNKQKQTSAAKRYMLKSIKHMEKASELAPLETHYLTELGKSLEEYGKLLSSKSEKAKLYTRTAAIYGKVLAMDGNNPWYHSRYGGAYSKLAKVTDDPEKVKEYKQIAENAARNAAKTDPNNPLFHLNLAYLLHRENKIDEAVDHYMRVIEIDDRMLEARFNMADIYRRRGKINGMLEQYLLVYEKNPNFPRARLAIAQHYIGKNQGDKALPYLEEEFEYNDKNRNVMINLLGIYHRKKEWTKLVRVYDTLFRRSPKDKKKYQSFYIQALVNGGYFDRANVEIERKLKANPNDPKTQQQLAAIKQLKAAKKQLQKR